VAISSASARRNGPAGRRSSVSRRAPSPPRCPPEHRRAAEGVEEHPRVEPRPAAGLKYLEGPPPVGGRIENVRGSRWPPFGGGLTTVVNNPPSGAGSSDASVYASRSTAESRCACACASYRAAPPRSGAGARGQPSATTARNSSARKAACAAPGSGWNVAFPHSRPLFRLGERRDHVGLSVDDRHGARRKRPGGEVRPGEVGKPFAQRAEVISRRYASCSRNGTGDTQASATGRSTARRTRERAARDGRERSQGAPPPPLRDTPAGSRRGRRAAPGRGIPARTPQRGSRRATTRQPSRTVRGAVEERREPRGEPLRSERPGRHGGHAGEDSFEDPPSVAHPGSRTTDGSPPPPTTKNSSRGTRASTTAATCRSVCAAVREKRRRADPRDRRRAHRQREEPLARERFREGDGEGALPHDDGDDLALAADGPPLRAKRFRNAPARRRSSSPRVSPDRQSRRAARSAAITGGGSAVE